MINQKLFSELNEAKAISIKEQHGVSISQLLRMVNFEPSDVEDLYAYCRDWLGINRTQFTNALRDYRLEEEHGVAPKKASQLVALVAKQNNVEVSYKGVLSRKMEVKDPQGKSVTDADLQSKEARIYVASYYSTHYRGDLFARDCRIACEEFGLAFTRHAIDDAVSRWIEEQRKEARYWLTARMFGTASDLSKRDIDGQWQALARAAFDDVEQSSEFAAAVLKKFVWMVKRKALGHEVGYHIMPVLLGAQGGGKSTLLQKFLEPVNDGVAYTDFGQITDDRNIDLWDNYVLVLDEMGFANRADWDKVKHIITAKMLTRRPMHTNRTEHVQQNATFIGSSNKDIQQLITDETGNRRFVALYCKQKMDFEVVNSTCFQALWGSVDPDGQDPLGAFAEELSKVQEAARAQSPVELWAAELSSEQYGDGVMAATLFDAYAQWEKTKFPLRNSTIRWFGSEMKRLMKQNVNFGWSDKKTSKGIKYVRNMF
ncbi:hypothetical protein A6A40_25050 (plasmid) [Azospirillum humicireducens]|uniref:Virulence-associated protein E-like domain-containing protein n=1 Tax=Azospirillum humicireducens TaxID=1226968 RepID=A0A2R4VV38_9PROT|nr:VapE domain-containing protein [Azospirillum humicireducens]AWB08310.1 hypothetical protein A6A40_25050 [Azospirillum humicireducens]